MIYVDMGTTKIKGEMNEVLAEYTALTRDMHQLLSDHVSEVAADILMVLMGRMAMNEGQIDASELLDMLEVELNEKEL